MTVCSATSSARPGWASRSTRRRCGGAGALFERMKAIVERHGGVVEKFIGDAVMAVFGVPALHEDDALRALRAAAEMREALPELGLQGGSASERRGRHRHGGAARDRRCGQRGGAARAGCGAG